MPDSSPDEYALPDLDGRSHRLSEWRGKVVLVNFWATWCGPCREEVPLLKDAQTRLQSQGLQIVGIAVDDWEPVAAYDREVRFNYPVLLGAADALELLTRYGNPQGSLPYSVVLDRSGTPVSRKVGAYRPDELDHVLKPLLSHPSK